MHLLALLAAATLLGFTTGRSGEQRALEARFDAALRADNLREWMSRLSARPHHVGSPYGRENARFIAAQFRSWGYEVRIEEFQILFPTPRERRLEMVAPRGYRARLAEPPLPGDATSGQAAEQLPTYNAYSIDGDVTGELVYVNYGVPADYEELERRGIDVKGKIVIARYGGSWRGIKPKVAAERGAIGCLIYSDPRDDGFYRGQPYPDGAWRGEHGVQRGSVKDAPLYSGDPLTPGVGATRDARRLDRKDAHTLTRIPVLPVSWGDALPLLREMTGPTAPEAWRGALPITYHLGPGPARVRLAVSFDWKLVPAYDVIATLRGSERPDEWILRGNHHDAWVNGAKDPVSGLVAMMEEARALASLRAAGWSPRRTVVYAAWDAEEQGLIGSTEWVETHAAELDAKAAVYINSDSTGRGFLEPGGTHSLEALMDEVARDVADPEKGVSVAERLRALRIATGSEEARQDARERGRLRIEALGSGSDYTPFLQHLGIASLNLGFGGEDEGGSYHSIYDSFDHYTRFSDATFVYGIAQARLTGRLVLRLAAADVLPFAFGGFAETVSGYVRALDRLAGEMRQQTEEHNRRLRERSWDLAADPQQPFVAPPARDAVPQIDFAPLHGAVKRLESAAAAYDQALGVALAGPLPPRGRLKALNVILRRAERALTTPDGLPGRPWYRHQVYAPGFYTGYGVKTLPGVREALEQREWARAVEQIEVVAGSLAAYAAEIEKATALLRPAP